MGFTSSMSCSYELEKFTNTVRVCRLVVVVICYISFFPLDTAELSGILEFTGKPFAINYNVHLYCVNVNFYKGSSDGGCSRVQQLGLWVQDSLILKTTRLDLTKFSHKH